MFHGTFEKNRSLPSSFCQDSEDELGSDSAKAASQPYAVLDVKTKNEYDIDEPIYKIRLWHITWAWFTSSMSTGGIALCLYRTPFKFQGLFTIGKIMFIFDLVLFVFICTGMVVRFCIDKGSFKRSLSSAHRAESLFFPTFWLSVAVTLNNIEVYAMPSCGRWLVDAFYSGYTWLAHCWWRSFSFGVSSLVDQSSFSHLCLATSFRYFPRCSVARLRPQ